MVRRSLVLTLLLSVGLTCTAAAQNGATFSVKNSATTFPNDTPVSADLNGDGIPDLVEVLTDSSTGIPGPNAFTVQIGKGDGTFGAPMNYPPGVSGWIGQIDSGIATADFNHDGKADLVVLIISQTGTSFETHLQYYMGNGDGTLAAPVTTLVADAV